MSQLSQFDRRKTGSTPARAPTATRGGWIYYGALAWGAIELVALQRAKLRDVQRAAVRTLKSVR